jgi:hypothetical protein
MIDLNKEPLSAKELMALKDEYCLLELKEYLANIIVLVLVMTVNTFLAYGLSVLSVTKLLIIFMMFSIIIIILCIRATYNIHKDFSPYKGDFSYELYELFDSKVKDYIKKIESQKRKILNIELNAIVEFSTLHRNISDDNYL